jgi:hypothetical protein
VSRAWNRRIGLGRAAGPVWIALLAVCLGATGSRAEDVTPHATGEAPQPPDVAGLVRVPPPTGHGLRLGPGADRLAAASPPASAAWWLSSAGIAAVLAACGAICIAARKHWPQGSTAALRIVGRMSLSPRHSIVLVQAGPRTLMIGLGPQSAPAILGELPTEAASGVDIRLGDDE